VLRAHTVEGGFRRYSIRERLISIDGNLSIESTSGSGTVVTAILPAALDESEASRSEKESLAQ
jgi:signal transduction histidine kinase